MKLSALKGRIVDLRIKVPDEDEPVLVRYRPGEVTLDVLDEMRGQIASGAEEQVLVTLLEKILVEWDLEEDVLDDAGDPTGEVKQLTTKAADIKKVPAPFLGQLVDAFIKDVRPDPQNLESSNGSSQQEGSPEVSQDGTSSFGLPSSTESHPGNS